MKHMKPLLTSSLIAQVALFSGAAFGFESTKILPKGVRNATLKTVTVSVSKQSDPTGKIEGLGSKMEEPYTFKKAINSKDAQVEKTMLKAFMLQKGFKEDDVIVNFTADIRSNINVVAPIFAFGVTDTTTVALAVPYYHAKVSHSLGVQGASSGQALVNSLPRYQAIETGDQLNNFEGQINKALRKHGFRTLQDWEGKGIGDITLAAKTKAGTAGPATLAFTGGVVAPTGRVDDPDQKLDVAFGTGAWSLFAAGSVDESLSKLASGLFLNQYIKLSHPLMATRSVRFETDEETINVEKGRVDYKLGDSIDAGASIQHEPANGLLSGLGVNYFTKQSDTYYIPSHASADHFERDTAQRAIHAEAKVGYSTVPAFQRGEIKVPFSTSLEYKKHLVSVNSPVKDFITLDMALFF